MGYLIHQSHHSTVACGFDIFYAYCYGNAFIFFATIGYFLRMVMRIISSGEKPPAQLTVKQIEQRNESDGMEQLTPSSKTLCGLRQNSLWFK